MICKWVMDDVCCNVLLANHLGLLRSGTLMYAQLADSCVILREKGVHRAIGISNGPGPHHFPIEFASDLSIFACVHTTESCAANSRERRAVIVGW